ncbi:dCTP deaminase domain-containing protein [Maribacter dokdonensis]|uniref:dCTP deaminase domain-containing protein n=1 Tax=Maribacter dokdonensis TaxID=320912 RepID=UPI002AAF9315|nr:hypothetical protein [Maribacter dokdonensis]
MSTIGRKELTKLITTNQLLNEYDLKNIKSASYDLRIGTIYKDGKIHSKDNVIANGCIKIKPSEIVTLLTLEVVNIPNDCVGTVFALNSMSSSGFLILNPGHIDPGFKGPISICAINLSQNDINLYHEQSIFTLILNKLDKKLSAEDVYRKNTYVDSERGDFERRLFSKKFSNLSNSFFDLVVKHEKGISLFKSLIQDNIKKYTSFILKWTLNILTFVVTLYGVLQFIDYVSPNPLFNSEKQNELLQNRDSIIETKDKEIILLIDEINKLKQNDTLSSDK